MIGLPPEHPSTKEVDPNITPEIIKQGVEKSKQAITAAGYFVQDFYVGPNDSLDGLKKELESRSWDGVMIGFGVRGNPKHTVFFEALVNLAKDSAPSAKLLFNSSPQTTMDALQRQLPILNPGSFAP